MRASRLTFVLASLALAAGCGGAASSGGATASPGPAAAGGMPAEVTRAAVAEGKMLFHTGACVQCHSQNGDGGTRGPALSDKQWLHSGSFYGILSIIKEGVPLADMEGSGYRQPMPARGGDRMNLTDAQATSIAAYVYSLTHPLPEKK